MQLIPDMAKRRCRVPRWATCVVLMWAVMASGLKAATPAVEKIFNVPSGDASTTLKQFATQSAEQIVYMLDNVRGEKTNAVNGSLTPRAALEKMLAGTALAPTQDAATGAFVVARKEPRTRIEPNASRSAPPSASARERSSAAKASSPDDAIDPIVRLSPFSVRGEQDTGYRATSTLAGTRLRSELRDLGASISVVTRSFMSDVNATDLTSLLVYTLGTEVGGYGGNFSDLGNPEAQGVFDDTLGQASPGTRIRGLINADRTRNYFLTDVPMDSYNLERVEISRGANANLFGLGSPAGIINSNLVQAGLAKTATTTSAAYGSYSSHRETLDHNQVLRRDQLALRLAAVFDHTRYPTDFAFQKKRGATLTGTYQPFPHTTVRATSELGRSDSNRPEQRPPFDRYSWWWAAGKPVWDPAAPGGGAGRLLGTPQAPFTETTVFAPDGTRQPQNFFTANWAGSAANEPMLVYLDPNRSTLGGLRIGPTAVVDGFKSFADASALNATGTALVGSGMLGLNSRTLIEQNIYQASNPLRTLFNREPMLRDPAVFDFYHQMLGGPTKYEFGWWDTHNITLEQTFLENRAGLELSFDRQRIDNGFTSPINYAINLDPNERLPNGAPNPNFLRPVTIGGGFKRIYSQDRDAARVTGYYHFDFRDIAAPRWAGRLLGRHLLNANYARQDYLYQQFGGTLWNSGLDWRAFENLSLPGTASSTARIVPVVHYLGNTVQSLATPRDARVQGLTAEQDPTGIPAMTLLTNQRPTSMAPSALNPWAPATFSLVTNGRYDVRNTIRNAQRYSDRLEQQVRSTSAVLQSHWLDHTLVTTAGWRRDLVWSFDSGIPGSTPHGTADVRWDVFYPKLTRSLAESSRNWGAVAHLPPTLRRRLPFGTEASVFYNHASNFRVAPQRYTITGVSLPSESGQTREYGLRFSTLNGKLELRVAHYKTLADHATASGLIGGLNQLAMAVPQVVDHNFLGDNVNNLAGIAAFETWLESPNGQIYRRAFSVNLLPNSEADRSANSFGRYADATGDRGQISGVSTLESKGYEFEVTFNPTRHWRISANAASATAVRTNIAPELYDFLFHPGNGLMRLIQNPDGSPSPAGQLIGTPIGGGTGTLQTFILGNVINNGVISTFAQEGTRTDELRKWSFRAVTNYSFSDELFDGRLKGFGLGGAVRWAAAPLLGYAGKTISVGGTTLAISDVTRPYYGDTEAIFDGWLSYSRMLGPRINWKLQLNVRNLGVGNSLKPLAAWPDGTVVQWTLREPQRWTLTNTFSF
jgi:outer membrane receptor protein involved in Fe transport